MGIDIVEYNKLKEENEKLKEFIKELKQFILDNQKTTTEENS